MPAWLAEIVAAAGPVLNGTAIYMVARLTTRIARIERHLGIDPPDDPPTATAARALEASAARATSGGVS